MQMKVYEMNKTMAILSITALIALLSAGRISMKANITFVFWMVLLASWTQCLGAENGFEKEAIKLLADRVRNFQSAPR